MYINDPDICKHFSVLRLKTNGKPCDIHGECLPFSTQCSCSDYDEDNLEDLINSIPTD